MPGELEAEFETLYGKEGVLLSADTVDGIVDAAKRLGVDAAAMM
jgi:hypothetical protein